MKLNDAIFGVLLLLLGGGVLWMVRNYPQIPGQQVGPALFPGLIALGLCVCGAVLLVRGARSRGGQPWAWADDWVRSPRHLLAFAVVIGSIVFYILAAGWLGFLLTGTLILAALFLALRVTPGRALLTAVLVTFAIHFAFYKLLRVPLPWGLLQNYAW